MPRTFDTPLPIDAVLDELSRTLAGGNAAVLVAPPGAGKTTRVPLALLDEPWAQGKKIIVLEPRRIAARASAERMAKTLGERAGETVGYRVRFGSKVSRATRIEVVTEGIFSRQILDDPELNGVAAVLFDEFHERSLDADLGPGAGARRADRLARGSAHPRDVGDARRRAGRKTARRCAGGCERGPRLSGRDALSRPQGRCAAGAADGGCDRDRRCAPIPARCWRSCPAPPKSAAPRIFSPSASTMPAIEIVPLFGALDAAVQDRAIAPAPKGQRKVVLATSIAETSLTIEGVRIVVDSGMARVPRYEPDIGLTRLETVRASRAAVDQRRGRAGRTEPGVCYRLWDEPQTASLAAYTQPEILSADLSSLVLDLAQWGVSDPATLAFLDPPPAPALKEAKSLLRELGALDADGRITAEGKSLRALALPPRLARMIVDSHGSARARRPPKSPPCSPSAGSAATASISMSGSTSSAATARSAPQRARTRAALGVAGGGHRGRAQARTMSPSTGVMLAFAFPDRVARNRGNGSFVLANGRGAAVEQTSALARAPYIAVAELTGTAASGRILLAAPITQAEIEHTSPTRSRAPTRFRSIAARWRCARGASKTLHAITLSEAPMALPPSAETARVLADGLIAAGLDKLPWSKPPSNGATA